MQKYEAGKPLHHTLQPERLAYALRNGCPWTVVAVERQAQSFQNRDRSACRPERRASNASMGVRLDF